MFGVGNGHATISRRHIKYSNNVVEINYNGLLKWASFKIKYRVP